MDERIKSKIEELEKWLYEGSNKFEEESTLSIIDALKSISKKG